METVRYNDKKFAFTRAEIVYADKNKKPSGKEYLTMGICMFLAWLAGEWLGFIGTVAVFVIAIFAAVCYGIKNASKARPADFVQISLPEAWPLDCICEGYADGLSTVAKSKKRTEKPKKQKDPALKFYKACCKKDIQNLSSLRSDPQKHEIAMQIARKQGYTDVTVTSVYKLFLQGKNMADRYNSPAVTARADQAAPEDLQMMRTMRIKELKELVSAMEYFGLYGMEKRKQMLKDLQEEARMNKEKARELKKDSPRLFFQRESNSSIAGGIAKGIGGLGAGLMVAADVERKNTETRAYNKKIASDVVAVMDFLEKDAEKYENLELYYRNKYNETITTDLISLNSAQLFQNLRIEQVKTVVSQTGAVKVTATFSKNPDYCINGDTRFVIDGAVAARLLRNGVQEASAYFVLPMEGISTKRVSLTTISTYPTLSEAEYTVKFEPVDLCAIRSV